MNRLAWLGDALEEISRKHLRRRRWTRAGPVAPESASPVVCRPGQQAADGGGPLIQFGSNDYLSLAADPRLARAAVAAIEEFGWGSGASPLVSGRTSLDAALEGRLAAFEGTEAALLFTSGYAANAGVIAAACGPGDAVFSDSKNHASILDGCRLSRADIRIFPHGDADALGRLLARSTRNRRRLIVTDGLFSMDGDLAPLPALVELADRYDAMLMVDEAHATGVFGCRGRGTAEHFGVEHKIDIRVGTLSKALGGIGGFVAGSQDLIDWLVQRARSYVYSTALPAAASGAATAAIDIVEQEPERRRRLLDSAQTLRTRLEARGWSTGASASQVIPLAVGAPDRATALAAALRKRGLFVPAIRPPSVPPGQSLLRISLCHGHTPEMIDRLVDGIGDVNEGPAE